MPLDRSSKDYQESKLAWELVKTTTYWSDFLKPKLEDKLKGVSNDQPMKGIEDVFKEQTRKAKKEFIRSFLNQIERMANQYERTQQEQKG